MPSTSMRSSPMPFLRMPRTMKDAGEIDEGRHRARDAAAQQGGNDGHKSIHLDNFLERPR
jgi:hypothetical protein